MSKKNKKKQLNVVGFTLVEILITLSIIGIVIPTITSIMFTLFRQQRSLMQLSQLKREGDAIRSYIRDLVKRSSYRITSYDVAGSPTYYCRPPIFETSYASTNGVNFYFLSPDNTTAFRLFVQNNQLVYNQRNSANLIPIHNSSVRVTNFSIGCRVVSRYSPPVVYMSFTLTPQQRLAGVTPKTITYRSIYKLSTF